MGKLQKKKQTQKIGIPKREKKSKRRLNSKDLEFIFLFFKFANLRLVQSQKVKTHTHIKNPQSSTHYLKLVCCSNLLQFFR